MAHEAMLEAWVSPEYAGQRGGRGGTRAGIYIARTITHFVILSSMLRGSNMKVGRTTRLRSAPGRSWDMMWERTGQDVVLAPMRSTSRRGAPDSVLFEIRTVSLIRLDFLIDTGLAAPRFFCGRSAAYRWHRPPRCQHYGFPVAIRSRGRERDCEIV
jgi:hypothetical protein